MTGHAKETTMLWDSFEMTLPMAKTTDNETEPMTTDNEIDDDDDDTDNIGPYGEFEISDVAPCLCPICEDGFIGPNGCSTGCND